MTRGFLLGVLSSIFVYVLFRIAIARATEEARFWKAGELLDETEAEEFAEFWGEDGHTNVRRMP